MKQGTGEYSVRKKRQTRRRRIVTGLACVVVFCTVYALILPAITMEKGACEIPEHTHTQECYSQGLSVEKTVPVCNEKMLGLHKHDVTCYDGEGRLTCGYADFVVHQHDSACYDESGTLWCPLPEIGVHQHTESCYTQPAQGHTHTDECYTVERGELICAESTEPAHAHTDDCYTETSALVCEEEHEHTESCYETARELTCGYTEAPAHQHSDQCYEQIKTLTCDLPTETAEEAEPAEPELICDKKEVILHEHTSDCFDDGDLICGKIQVLEHQHTDACFETVEEPVDTETLTCTLPEDENHTHGPLCYGTWKLTCGLEEHQHSEACQAAELTEEEQGQVEEVIALIDTLPASEEIEETAEAFEEAEDEDGLETYLSELYPQVNAAYEAYSALTDAQKAKVTNADKLMELEWIWSAATLDLESGVLTDDSAYVESIAISQYDTGTAPFDSDDRPGNDSSSTNMVVRTFDTVTYNIKVKYLTYENGKTFNDTRVKLEFVLPVDVSQAEFDQTAMGWMEDPVLTTETRTINGVETQCQVLTSYKHLLPSADHTSVVPGEFGENVSVNIKMMKNGDTIAPIFSAAMEYNTWDGTCATHNAEEKKTIVADDITISAAPKYNVQIKPAAAAEASMTYDFSRSSSQLFNVDKALNLDAGQRPGRIYVMGVTLQLYNDNESKQMRGIELPQGPITFEIKLSSKFQPVYRTAQATTAAGTVMDVTDEYTPLVWSYGPQSDGNNPDRNTWMTSYGYAFGSAAP